MTLTDSDAMRNIIGCLMLNPLLLVEYTDIIPADFDDKVARVCYITISNMYNSGVKTLTVVELDQEIKRTGGLAEKIYQDGNGLEFLKWAYENAALTNFDFYYRRLKKYSLLRRLQKDKYDISEYYLDDKYVVDPLQEIEIKQHFDNATLEEILNSIESKYNIIRNDYLNGGRMKGDPAEGINDLIEKLKTTPSVGPSLEGDYFSTCCRGARSGCFFLKSASTSAGKTRTAVFDACRLCYPKRWSEKDHSFIIEAHKGTGEIRNPRKVLFIVTEMDKEELQTIILAYLSGIDEDHIIRGDYDMGEELRVRYAAHIMQEYSGYFIIEEISEPDLNNVQSTIKKYATVDDVKYVFFDYIHTTANLVSQFAKNHLREDVVLMLLANELKQLAKDYNLFIFSATQVNAFAMTDDGEFKNEMSIRGSKAVADKADMGFVMTRVNEKLINTIAPKLQDAVNKGDLPSSVLLPDKQPTHVLDIYKMRRGQFKNVRIWTRLHLGTGEREDLFVTSADNVPIKNFTAFDTYTKIPFDFEKEKDK